jgi:hypothetical protein
MMQYASSHVSSGAVVAAGAAATYYLTQPNNGSHRPHQAYVVFSNAITADDTNYSTYNLVVAGSTVGTFNTKTSASGGTGNITAGDRVAFTLSSKPSTAQGAAVNVAKVESGTGQALGVNSHLAVGWEAVR